MFCNFKYISLADFNQIVICLKSKHCEDPDQTASGSALFVYTFLAGN